MVVWVLDLPHDLAVPVDLECRARLETRPRLEALQVLHDRAGIGEVAVVEEVAVETGTVGKAPRVDDVTAHVYQVDGAVTEHRREERVARLRARGVVGDQADAGPTYALLVDGRHRQRYCSDADVDVKEHPGTKSTGRVGARSRSAPARVGHRTGGAAGRAPVGVRRVLGTPARSPAGYWIVMLPAVSVAAGNGGVPRVSRGLSVGAGTLNGSPMGGGVPSPMSTVHRTAKTALPSVLRETLLGRSPTLKYFRRPRREVPSRTA